MNVKRQGCMPIEAWNTKYLPKFVDASSQ